MLTQQEQALKIFDAIGEVVNDSEIVFSIYYKDDKYTARYSLKSEYVQAKSTSFPAAILAARELVENLVVTATTQDAERDGHADG